MTRYNVRTFLDPRDDEGHLIAWRVSMKRVDALAAESAASTGDDFWPVEIEDAPEPRFRIKIARHVTRNPIKLADRERPAFVGQYPTLAAACRAMDNIVRRERGMPERIGVTPADVEARMHHGQHVQGCISCYAYLDATLAFDSIERGSFA